MEQNLQIGSMEVDLCEIFMDCWIWKCEIDNVECATDCEMKMKQEYLQRAENQNYTSKLGNKETIFIRNQMFMSKNQNDEELENKLI